MAYKNSGHPKANEAIEADEVRLVDDAGNMLGVLKTKEAIDQAKSKGLDLVEVSPGVTPPVCKMLDYGRYKFSQRRKENQNRKKQKTVHIKEIKLRPNIEKHDYDVKMRSIQKFIGESDKVKVSLRFRGREVVHKEIGFELMQRIIDDTVQIAKTELAPKIDGKQILMVLAPR